MIVPSSRINAQMAAPSCGLFLTCRGKINNKKWWQKYVNIYSNNL
jgi:hypothetical protein